MFKKRRFKMKVFEFAKFQNLSSNEIIEQLNKNGFSVNSHLSDMPEESYELFSCEKVDNFERNTSILNEKLRNSIIKSISLIITAFVIYFLAKSPISPLNLWLPIFVAIILLFLVIRFYTHSNADSTLFKDKDFFQNVVIVRLKRRNAIMENIVLVSTIIVAIYFVFGLLFVPTFVSGKSMEPNVEDADKVLVWNISYHIKRFDVVVAYATTDETTILDNTKLIKRVIGLPGDYIEFKNDKLYVNGNYVEEPFLLDDNGNKVFETYDFKLEDVCGINGDSTSCSHSDGFYIPDGYYFLMGDHRNASEDSRSFGLISEKEIFGKVIFTYWPMKSVGVVK